MIVSYLPDAECLESYKMDHSGPIFTQMGDPNSSFGIGQDIQICDPVGPEFGILDHLGYLIRDIQNETISRYFFQN